MFDFFFLIIGGVIIWDFFFSIKGVFNSCTYSFGTDWIFLFGIDFGRKNLFWISFGKEDLVLVWDLLHLRVFFFCFLRVVSCINLVVLECFLVRQRNSFG